ncbi:MAG: SWIM zinc finger family protein [Candidatus Hinthialibacter sp.]
MPKKKWKFEDVKWDDLNSWAGSKIVNRGRSYKSEVEDLRVTERGGLLAWVWGTEKYATHVWIEQNTLECDCTCPYDWGPCKHAVAVILLYLDYVKEKKKIKPAQANDPRFECLEEGSSDDWDDNDEIDSSLNTIKQSPTKALRTFLEKKKKTELVEWILDLIDQEPELRNKITDQMNLSEGNLDQLRQSIRADIDEITDEPAWSNHWSGESSIPDYSGIEQKFEALLKKGHTDELVELGQYLFSQGNKQIEQSDDDGMTATKISQCMEIAFKAVSDSSLSTADQLIWMIDLFLQDEYNILDGYETYLRKRIYTKSDWKSVSEKLENQLSKMPAIHGDSSFSEKYKRSQLIDWIIFAYNKGGKVEKVVPLLEREVKTTQCYERLVDCLIDSKEYEKAREWARRGFEDTVESLSGLAWSLERRLREIAVIENNKKLVASYRVLEFTHSPGLNAYKDLQKAAKAIRLWPTIQEAALHFLETGKPPEKRNSWPLPDCGLTIPKPRFQPHFPDTKTLIDIAIEEKRLEDVLKWFKIQKQKHNRALSGDDRIAEALQLKYPNISLDIWRTLAESHIELVKPSEYQTAAIYLRKMRNLYQSLKRMADWKQYMSILRSNHKAKRRLMQILDTLDGRKIIDG